MKKSDKERLIKVISIWDEVQNQIRERNITKEDLLADTFLQWALTTPLYNMGEQVYQLSPELKRAYPDVPWSQIAGVRHRLVHDYEGVNWSIIVDIIFDEMDAAIQKMKDIVQKMNDAE